MLETSRFPRAGKANRESFVEGDSVGNECGLRQKLVCNRTLSLLNISRHICMLCALQTICFFTLAVRRSLNLRRPAFPTHPRESLSR